MAVCRDLPQITPCSRWDAELYYTVPGSETGTYARFGAYCSGLDGFDAAYFSLPASEVLALDPHTPPPASHVPGNCLHFLQVFPYRCAILPLYCVHKSQCMHVQYTDAAYFSLPTSEALALDPHTRNLLHMPQVPSFLHSERLRSSMHPCSQRMSTCASETREGTHIV